MEIRTEIRTDGNCKSPGIIIVKNVIECFCACEHNAMQAGFMRKCPVRGMRVIEILKYGVYTP